MSGQKITFGLPNLVLENKEHKLQVDMFIEEITDGLNFILEAGRKAGSPHLKFLARFTAQILNSENSEQLEDFIDPEKTSSTIAQEKNVHFSQEERNLLNNQLQQISIAAAKVRNLIKASSKNDFQIRKLDSVQTLISMLKNLNINEVQEQKPAMLAFFKDFIFQFNKKPEEVVI